MMFNAFMVYTCVFIDGGIAGSGIIWSLVVPFFAFLLMGLPVAWYWVGLYAAINGLLIALHFKGHINLPYDDSSLTYFPAAFIFFSLIAAVFEVQLERLHRSHEGTINELEALRGNLELHVESKTKELTETNKKLHMEIEHHKNTSSELEVNKELFFRAQKMESLGTLVGGIAHDFNNMLAGITCNLYLAKKKSMENSDVVEKIASAEELAGHASEMIKQLLIFARQDAAEMSVFSLSKTTKEAFKLAGIAVPKHIKCECNIADDELVIRGNKTQVQQLVMNLINNARDAVLEMRNPAVSCNVSMFNRDDDFHQRHADISGELFAKLSMVDNGCGIPESKLENIFEPFFTTKEAGKGTGLGLSMAYGSVKSHGGVIEVESQLGKGTAFHVYFPIINMEAAALIN